VGGEKRRMRDKKAKNYEATLAGGGGVQAYAKKKKRKFSRKKLAVAGGPRDKKNG